MNGILLIDKPEGWTSMDVCAKLRRALGECRVGYAGTLDPLATGLLTVFLGRATWAVEFAEGDSKTYEATLRLGCVTDTQDVTGTVLETHPVDITPEQLDAALGLFRGEIEQLPPMYSALKVNGKKLYELARKGRTVERKPRPVTIYALDVTGWSGNDVSLRVKCSKGTYIRTLCYDIGMTLGCGGTMAALRRTAAGQFSIAQAHGLPDVLAAAERDAAEDLLLPVETLFADRPDLVLTAGQTRVIRNGGAFTWAAPEGEYRLRTADGEFLALGRVGEGSMRAVKSFFEVE